MEIDVRQYRGNSKLKREGEKIPFGPKEIEEFKKCMEDPIYFSQNYMKIVSIDRGLETIKLYDHQKQILKNFSEFRHNIILSARQTGKCLRGNMKIKVRNKKTGEEKEMTIKKFFEMNVHENK